LSDTQLVECLSTFARVWLRVGGNGKNGDYTFGRTVVPEDPIGGGCTLLGIRLKNLLPVGSFQTDIFMGLEAGMPGIHRQELDGLSDSLVMFALGGIFFKQIIGFACLRCPL